MGVLVAGEGIARTGGAERSGARLLTAGRDGAGAEYVRGAAGWRAGADLGIDAGARTLLRLGGADNGRCCAAGRVARAGMAFLTAGTTGRLRTVRTDGLVADAPYASPRGGGLVARTRGRS